MNLRFRLNGNRRDIGPDLYADLAESNVGRRYWDMSVNAIPKEKAHKQPIISYIKNYAHLERDGVGVLLYGGHGTGKTALLSILVREALRLAPCSAWFISMAQVDWYARNRSDTNSLGTPVWDLITGAQIVAIDDVGAERDAVWNDCWLEEVLRERSNKRLATHISSNIGPEDMGRRFGWFNSFGADNYVILEVTGEWRVGEVDHLGGCA